MMKNPSSQIEPPNPSFLFPQATATFGGTTSQGIADGGFVRPTGTDAMPQRLTKLTYSSEIDNR
jgi:hypothetical protein